MITVDFQKRTGRMVRPLHGVNSGPLTKVFTYDARNEFREAGIPYARLHDVEYPYGSGEFVDMHCIFKNFDADETKEENYSFKLTDLYLRACCDAGTEPFYRIGESIEHAPVKLHIYPPKDYGKWARIAEHIIMHYTEGWAEGFHWPIQYWEIYNEPDGRGNMWRGTPEEFYELYAETAIYLKKRFPHLSIGGCGFTRPINDFIEGFLKYISTYPEPVPMDFFSWHLYTADVGRFGKSAAVVDELLKKYGYSDAESILNEWNYMRDWNDQPDSYRAMKNHVGASFYAAVLSELQTKTDVSLSCLFEADVVKEFCGLFNVKDMWIGNHGCKASVEKIKGFYAFKVFGQLYRLGNEVKVDSEDEELYMAAAADDAGHAGLLIANPGDSEKEVSIDWNGLKPVRMYVTDENRTYQESAYSGNVVLPAHSFVYLETERTENS